MGRWANAVPDPARQQALKRQAIIREAASIFSRRGWHGATLDDVAERLGGSKTALYRYVRDKHDLLFICHEEALGIADGSILPLNPKLAVFMLLGAIHWATKWYRPDGAWTGEDISHGLIELLTRGLASGPAPALTASLHRFPEGALMRSRRLEPGS